MRQPRAAHGRLALASGLAMLLPLALWSIITETTWSPATSMAQALRRHGPGREGAERPGDPAGRTLARTGPLRLRPSARSGLSILQIGDSHTAADLFTGAVRRALQRRFGVGGPGYMPVGLPHAGVRSTQLTVSASRGWTYEGIQRSASPELFDLSGFNATTRLEGESLSFSSLKPVAYTRIEIEARTGPDAGSVKVLLDDRQALAADLASQAPGHTVLRIPAPGTARAAFRKLVVQTSAPKPVTLSSLNVYRQDEGLSYSAVGFPGATIDILARFPNRTLRDALSRIEPDMIVLAFGTNEGFDDKLDLAAYRERYRAVIGTIRQMAPRAEIVMVGPPQAERLPPACRGPAGAEPCRSSAPPSGGSVDPTGTATVQACIGPPPHLEGVRAAQHRLADEERIAFFDWWAIMPAACGAARWVAAEPPLMAKDHVHFTKTGYTLSGNAFAAFLEPKVEAVLRGDNAVSNH